VKDVFVIGGPNGAGNTTASNRILPASIELSHFLNADEIARALSPSDLDSAAIAAGRLLLEGIEKWAKALHSRRRVLDVRIFSGCASVVQSAIGSRSFSSGYPRRTLPWQE
jgi:predicted ABC-type ATPase